MILCPMLCLAALTACDDDDNDIRYAAPEAITIGQKSFGIGAGGGDLTTSVSASSAFATYTDAAWLTASPRNSLGREGDLTISVGANSAGERTGHVIVHSGGTRDTISVRQEAGTQSIKCPIEGYTLVWNDEFDGTSLSADWTAATGTGSGGWGNNELQSYTADAATVSGGTLKITLADKGGQATSARLYAKVSTGWRYGYIEASIKCPKGRGTWPAFWMMPVNFTAWPADGEIDIMEHVGYAPTAVHSTIHCNKYNNTGTSIETSRHTLATAESEFHAYAVEWTAKRMTFYVDGTAILTYENDGTGRDAWPFDKAFYPILNLAWGGNWGGQQGIDASCLPAVMEVDYVRIYQ